MSLRSAMRSRLPFEAQVQLDRSEMQAGYSLALYDSVQRSDAFISDLTDKLEGWRRSIRSVGGYWGGTGSLTGSRDTWYEMYLEGLGRRIVESVGGQVTWEGFIIEMELTLDGITYTRSLLPCANAVRAIYTKVGDNLLTNGSAESSVWGSVGAPATIERVTTWQTKGTYGMHIVADDGEGAQIGSGIAITAGRAYRAQVTLEIESGTWEFEIRRSDNDEVLARRTRIVTGREIPRLYIGDDNEYGGNVYVQLISDDAASEVYADAASLRLAPERSETEWVTDSDSITEWGRKEEVLLEAGMSDDAAGAKVAKEVTRRAWPRSRPPERFLSGAPSGQADGLNILFAGYSQTLKWKHLLASGTDTASSHVETLIGEAEFVSDGVIETNSLDYQVEEQDPVLIWDAIEDIIHTGDGTGARWVGGVYADRQFDYEAASTTPDYHYRNGQMLEIGGGVVKPWFAKPGLVRLDDAPVGPGEISGEEADDPRNIWISEVEFVAPDQLIFKREAGAERGAEIY